MVVGRGIVDSAPVLGAQSAHGVGNRLDLAYLVGTVTAGSASYIETGLIPGTVYKKAASASWPDEWIIVGQNTFWESHSLPDGDYNARIRAVDNAGNVGPPSAEGTVTVVQTGKVFFHNDHLGSPRVVTGSSGEVLHVMEYKPFGQPHEVLVTSVIYDRPLEAATDLAGRMVR